MAPNKTHQAKPSPAHPDIDAHIPDPRGKQKGECPWLQLAHHHIHPPLHLIFPSQALSYQKAAQVHANQVEQAPEEE